MSFPEEQGGRAAGGDSARGWDDNESGAPGRQDGPAGGPADLQAALSAAEERAKEAQNQYLRTLAELDNVRKRAVKDVEQAHKYALEKFAAELIGVKDRLEMGLAASAGADAKVLQEGTQATLKLLEKAFQKAGVLEVVPDGQPFNPEMHEAMAAQPTGDAAPNTVLQVIQKGYQLNGRLIRPARVIVSREP